MSCRSSLQSSSTSRDETVAATVVFCVFNLLLHTLSLTDTPAFIAVNYQLPRSITRNSKMAGRRRDWFFYIRLLPCYKPTWAHWFFSRRTSVRHRTVVWKYPEADIPTSTNALPTSLLEACVDWFFRIYKIPLR